MTTARIKQPIELNLNQEGVKVIDDLRSAFLDGTEVYVPGIGYLKVEGRGVRGSKDGSRPGGFKPVMIATFEEKFKREALAAIESGTLTTNRTTAD